MRSATVPTRSFAFVAGRCRHRSEAQLGGAACLLSRRPLAPAGWQCRAIGTRTVNRGRCPRLDRVGGPVSQTLPARSTIGTKVRPFCVVRSPVISKPKRP